MKKKIIDIFDLLESFSVIPRHEMVKAISREIHHLLNLPRNAQKENTANQNQN